MDITTFVFAALHLFLLFIIAMSLVAMAGRKRAGKETGRTTNVSSSCVQPQQSQRLQFPSHENQGRKRLSEFQAVISHSDDRDDDEKYEDRYWCGICRNEIDTLIMCTRAGGLFKEYKNLTRHMRNEHGREDVPFGMVRVPIDMAQRKREAKKALAKNDEDDFQDAQE